MKARKAEYALSAEYEFTVDFRYAGTPESVMAETELSPSITVDSGTEAKTRPSAAFTASQSACDVTPFAPLALPLDALQIASAGEQISAPWSRTYGSLVFGVVAGLWYAHDVGEDRKPRNRLLHCL